jgi:hypothetical protein
MTGLPSGEQAGKRGCALSVMRHCASLPSTLTVQIAWL